jgi:hypothetical protein
LICFGRLKIGVRWVLPRAEGMEPARVEVSACGPRVSSKAKEVESET